MLAVTVGNHLGAAQAQRKVRIGLQQIVRIEGGHRTIAGEQKPLGIDLDLAARRRVAARPSIGLDSLRIEWNGAGNVEPGRVGPQHLHGQAGSRQHRVVTLVRIEPEEPIGKA